MGKPERDAIYSAYLGICVLQTMCRKAGLTMGAERSQELLVELGTVFPFIARKGALSALRQVECERCGEGVEGTIKCGGQTVCFNCAREIGYEDLRASGGIVGAP